MPGRTLRIAIRPPIKLTDFKGILIEYKVNGKCTVGIVEEIRKYGYGIEILATDNGEGSLNGFDAVPFKSDYRNIDREDLPIYIGLKNKSERFESILAGEE